MKVRQLCRLRRRAEHGGGPGGNAFASFSPKVAAQTLFPSSVFDPFSSLFLKNQKWRVGMRGTTCVCVCISRSVIGHGGGRRRGRGKGMRMGKKWIFQYKIKNRETCYFGSF